MLIVISCVNTNLHIANMLKDSVSFMSIKLSVQLTLVGKVTLFFASLVIKTTKKCHGIVIFSLFDR